MKKTIFISSTYVDLVENRKTIWELLGKYDVNVKGMEAFGARKEAPIETCLNEVSQSDIYIGIVAHRLGSIEKNSGKSFTQLEYERAVKEDKEILIYIINDNDSLVSINHVDFEENRTKLLNFKTILKDKHTIDTFKGKNDLSKKIETRLDEILTNESKIISAIDGYDSSKEILEKFQLLPRAYSSQEIIMNVKLKDKAYPVSKELCSRFGYEYGKTIGIPIEIIKPKVDGVEFNEIFVEEDLTDVYFNKKGQSIDIKAKLLFTSGNIDTTKANFFDRTYTEYEPNPNYDPLSPSHDSFNFTSIYINANPKYITKEKIIKGEGKAILELKEMLEN